MAAFNFPNSPNQDDTHNENGVQWKYDGTVWKRVPSTGAQGAPGAVGAQGAPGESGMNHNGRTSGYTLVAGDDQKLVTMTTGDCTVAQNVFSVADAITIYNSSGSTFSILQGSGVTLRLGGTSTTGNRTLSSKGIATVVCVASNEFVVSGAGLA